MTTIRLYSTEDNNVYTEFDEIVSMELRLTDGNPCDSFHLLLPYKAALYRAAQEALYARILRNGRVVFTGVPDEFECIYDAGGGYLSLTGRGLAAMLMETESGGAEFVRASMGDIRTRYIDICGIRNVAADSLPSVPYFDVTSGTTCWRAVMNFCGWAAGIMPRFDDNGTLIIRRPTQSTPLIVDGTSALVSAHVGERRRGLICSATVVERTSGKRLTHTDDQMSKSGIFGEATITAPHGKLSAYLCRAEWLVEQSKRNWRVAEIKLAGGFAAAPCDTVQLTVGGVAHGVYTVKEAVTVSDKKGEYTTLHLWRDSRRNS